MLSDFYAFCTGGFGQAMALAFAGGLGGAAVFVLIAVCVFRTARRNYGTDHRVAAARDLETSL